jgi:DNA-binding NtrC family response regulator
MSVEIPLQSENQTCVKERSSVLLADRDIELLSYRALLLSRSNYSVITAGNYREIFDLRGERSFLLAVLSCSLGEFALRAAAEFVRRQWPSARILILGSARAILDDSLYDEAVDCRFQPQELLNVIERLCEDDWTLRSRIFGSPPGTGAYLDKRSTTRQLALVENRPRDVAHNIRAVSCETNHLELSGPSPELSTPIDETRMAVVVEAE